MQATVTESHYLRRPVDARCSVEAYAVHLYAIPVGLHAVDRRLAARIPGRLKPTIAIRSLITYCKITNHMLYCFQAVK